MDKILLLVGVACPFILVIILMVVMWGRKRNAARRVRKSYQNSEILDRVLVSQFRGTDNAQYRNDKRAHL